MPRIRRPSLRRNQKTRPTPRTKLKSHQDALLQVQITVEITDGTEGAVESALAALATVAQTTKTTTGMVTTTTTTTTTSHLEPVQDHAIGATGIRVVVETVSGIGAQVVAVVVVLVEEEISEAVDDSSSSSSNNSVDGVALDHPPREALLAAVAVVELVERVEVVGPEVPSRQKAPVASTKTRKIPVSGARVDPVVLWTVGGGEIRVEAGARVDRVAALPTNALGRTRKRSRSRNSSSSLRRRHRIARTVHPPRVDLHHVLEAGLSEISESQGHHHRL